MVTGEPKMMTRLSGCARIRSTIIRTPKSMISSTGNRPARPKGVRG
jgi:hypothetical protein